MPIDEVISCPSCRHVVRVPEDWLGTQVQCPECQAMFRAPVRQPDGQLSASVLISTTAVPTTPKRSRPDWLLLFPAFGLMLCGVVATLLDGVQFAGAILHPDQAKENFEVQIQSLRKMGLFDDNLPEAERKKQDAQMAEEGMPQMKAALAIFTVVGILTFAGGVAIVMRRFRGLAITGCVAAMLNPTMCCCIPGGIFGIWALLLLFTSEGRTHFKA